MTTMPAPRTVVAVINTNPDLVRLLRVAIEQAGFIVVITHIEDIKVGAADIDAFLRQHDPKVIVYDLAPPYDQNWSFLHHLRATTELGTRRFVLTTVNARLLQQVVGSDEFVYEIAGQRDDIDAVVRAVKEASRARSTR
jgi:CheY-like chemotaxis protein